MGLYKCKYFGIKEIVSKIVYDFYVPKYGENFVWGFFDEDNLKDLDTIRQTWGKPIIINNWAFGGDLSQCGLRCNLTPLLKPKKRRIAEVITLQKVLIYTIKAATTPDFGNIFGI